MGLSMSHCTHRDIFYFVCTQMRFCEVKYAVYITVYISRVLTGLIPTSQVILRLTSQKGTSYVQEIT